jgi:hypothetical protein
MKKIVLVAVLMIAMALAVPRPASAGCCVVVTLDSVPGDVVAGEPVEIGFTVYFSSALASAFGEKPHLQNVAVTAFNGTAGGNLLFDARPDGVRGHAVASLVFPTAGNWNWQTVVTAYDGNWGPQKMPPLSVLSAPAPQQTLAAQVFSSAWHWVALASGLAAALAFISAGGVALRLGFLPAVLRGS